MPFVTGNRGSSAPDLFDDRLERVACRVEREDIGGKRVLRSKRLAIRVGLYELARHLS
jgi:hypothetical protein